MPYASGDHLVDEDHEWPEAEPKQGDMSIHEVLRSRRGTETIEDDEKEVDASQSNRYDQRDMQRLGKQQVLKRNFRALSMLSFTMIVQATWEFVLV